MKTQVDDAAVTPLSRERLLSDLASASARRAFMIALDLLRDRAAAEEAVQEGLARACASFDRLRDPEALQAWFFRVVTNICLRRLRRRRLRRALVGWWRAEDTSPPPDQVVAREKQQRDAVRAMNALPDRQRAALLLRYGYDLSVADVASMLEVSTETAKTHLARGMRRLREQLGRTYDGSK